MRSVLLSSLRDCALPEAVATPSRPLHALEMLAPTKSVKYEADTVADDVAMSDKLLATGCRW